MPRRRHFALPIPGRTRPSPAPTAPTPRSDLPPPVALDLDRPVRDLWGDRALQLLHDRYAGVPLLKLPEHVRVYRAPRSSLQGGTSRT